MATVMVVTETDNEGRVTETRRTLTPAEVGRRGRVSQKALKAFAEGTGRRKRSPYQARAVASARGVLPDDESVLTREVFRPHRSTKYEGRDRSYSVRYGIPNSEMRQQPVQLAMF